MNKIEFVTLQLLRSVWTKGLVLFVLDPSEVFCDFNRVGDRAVGGGLVYIRNVGPIGGTIW